MRHPKIEEIVEGAGRGKEGEKGFACDLREKRGSTGSEASHWPATTEGGKEERGGGGLSFRH